MSASPSLSLRERKKAETWAAIHEAAAALVMERGIERTTVEAIAESVGISARTFFNYFPSKEDAVLGMRAPVLDPTLLEGFSLEHDALEQVAELLLAVVRSAYEGGDPARRQALMAQYPYLGQRRREYFGEAEELVRRTLAEQLATDPNWSEGVDNFDADEHARMFVMLAGVPLRFALTSPAYETASGVTGENLASSLNLFHHVQRKLS
jgi:AcrR family transcriptional regulator